MAITDVLAPNGVKTSAGTVLSTIMGMFSWERLHPSVISNMLLLIKCHFPNVPKDLSRCGGMWSFMNGCKCSEGWGSNADVDSLIIAWKNTWTHNYLLFIVFFRILFNTLLTSLTITHFLCIVKQGLSRWEKLLQTLWMLICCWVNACFTIDRKQALGMIQYKDVFLPV